MQGTPPQEGPVTYTEQGYDQTAPHGNYWSSVEVEAVLKGEAPEGHIGLPGRSREWQCGGGARLREGDRVLLFLYRDRAFRNYPDGFIWNNQLLGGQVVLSQGEAYLTDYQAADYLSAYGRDHLGTAQDVVSAVAAMLGSSEAATAHALAWPNGHPAPSNGRDHRRWWSPR